MPHLLVAGATGQGKSVGLNVIITSLLYRKHPSQLKFVFVDPKKVELSLYSKIEHHYLAKIPGRGEAIITDVDLVVETLVSLCNEMDTRYELLKAAMVRNIEEYNERFISGRLPIEKHHRYLPYIVVVIDEYADLIMTAGRDVEQPIARLAQLARAIGIHLVIATQRPTANIITGMIKANFPARIAFRVSSAVDSPISLVISLAMRARISSRIPSGGLSRIPRVRASLSRSAMAFLRMWRAWLWTRGAALRLRFSGSTQ